MLLMFLCLWLKLTQFLPHTHIHFFPNPFLIKQNLPSSSPIMEKSVTDPPLSFSSSTLSQNTGKPCTLSISHTLTNSSQLPSALTRKPQKPWLDRVLAYSPFHPRVMAMDRLFSWHTPYGISHDESLLAELPPILADSAKMLIMGSLAASSKSTYAAGLLRLNQFCDRWQISEGACMPASYALLCTFIGNHKGAISGKTIKSWLSGIHAWHLVNHAPWYGDDKWVKMARNFCK